MWMLRGFSTFSSSSGLCLNKEKTDIYFNGVFDQIISNIRQISGFRRGALSFKYLGVPISSKRLTKNERAKLTDKIVARIRAWGTRRLSYAGCLVLVNAVLTSLHSYWATIFLIPSGVMNRIDSLCRNFLWEGKDSYSRAPNVSWNTCCNPKEEGGLDTSWQDYVAPSDCSWSWKKVIQVKDKFKAAYSGNLWLHNTKPYTVAEGYLWLKPPAPKVPWRHVCWNPLNVPKTSFIYWASKHQRLLTRDRIIRMGFGQDDRCFLCDDAPEDHVPVLSLCIQSEMYQSFANKIENYFSTSVV
ncbi:uncharacterized protein LOC141601180 [Silene latifolia]|uniref:uncharacterized protein LOC141601180 n=1 Tax=Silene latifolia TaxID=37657 RepID=UPI003D76A748